MDQNDRSYHENDELRADELQKDAPQVPLTEENAAAPVSDAAPAAKGTDEAAVPAAENTDEATEKETAEQTPADEQPADEQLADDAAADAPKPKRSKKPLILSLSITGGVLLIAAAVLLFLFWPIMTLDPVSNTLDLIFFDTAALADFSSALEKSGTSTDVSIKLPNTNNLPNSFAIDINELRFGQDQDNSGKTTLTLSSGEESFEVTVWWDAESIVFRGLSDEVTVSIPRQNAARALENSIFNPDSKSRFALEQESYDQLRRLLPMLDSRPVEEREDDDVAKRLTAILTEWVERFESENDYFFDKETRKLCKRVTYTVTDGDIKDLLNAVIDELRTELADLKITPAEQGDPENLLDALKAARDELQPTTCTLSYTVKDRKLSFARLIWESEGEDVKDRSELWLTFVYGEEECGFDMEMLVEQKGEKLEREEGTIAAYRRTERDGETELSFTGESTLTVKGQSAGYKHSSFEARLTYEHEGKNYTLIMTDTEERTAEEPVISETDIRGQFEFDPEAGKLWLTVNRISADGVLLYRNLFEINVAACASKPEITLPESTLLFGMDAAACDRFLRGLRVRELEEVVTAYTGRELGLPHTVDGDFLYNYEECMESATAAAEEFKTYLNGTSNPIKYIYVYDKSLDVYILLDYDPSENMIWINFAAALDEAQSAKYCKATMTHGVLAIEK